MIPQLDAPTKKKLLLVNVPEGAYDFRMREASNFKRELICRIDNDWDYIMDEPENDEFNIIGLLSEVKEFDEYVEKYRMLDDEKGKPLTMGGYKLYNGEFWTTLSSKSSFLSLLRREGFVLEEPKEPEITVYGQRRNLNDDVEDNATVIHKPSDTDYWNYRKQLSKYINPKTTLLIEVKS